MDNEIYSDGIGGITIERLGRSHRSDKPLANRAGCRQQSQARVPPAHHHARRCVRKLGGAHSECVP